jgi:hypothetical protein
MDDFELAQCERLLRKIHAKPLARMLNDGWTDLSGSLTLDRIADKLNSRVYVTPFDFYLDLRLLLELRDPQFVTNRVVNIMLEDLTNWVTIQVGNLPRTSDEAKYFKLRKLIDRIRTIISAMAVRTENALTEPDGSTPESQPLVSPKTPLQAGQRRIEVLQQRLEHLRTPEELQSVLRILQKHIPQFTLAPEVVIEGRYITKACAKELRDYLNSVNA